MVYLVGSALKRRKGDRRVMLDTKSIHIKRLSCVFILLLVVLALFNKNTIDFIYLGFVFILILKFCIERLRK